MIQLPARLGMFIPDSRYIYIIATGNIISIKLLMGQK